MPRFAAIDLGSNALRLRIVETHVKPSDVSSIPSFISPPSNGQKKNVDGRLFVSSFPPPSFVHAPHPAIFTEIASIRTPVRLGTEVFHQGKLGSLSLDATTQALRDFRKMMDNHHVDAYRAAATSAVREAQNGSQLVERARREANIDLEIIDGAEEARLIQLAVMRKIPLFDKRALLVDVGGGSTEVTYLISGKTEFSVSLPLGSVRLLESFLQDADVLNLTHISLLQETIVRAYASIARELKGLPVDVMIGTGGNMETLAHLCPALGYLQYPKAVDVVQMKKLISELCAMGAKERRERYQLRSDRADTIVPASLIFFHAATELKAPAIVYPGVGLKEGLLIEVYEKHLHFWDEQGEEEQLMASCMRLGHRYRFDERHAATVAFLAKRLFDDTEPLHRLSKRDLVLLRAAALLHDIGDYVRYDAHHKHSFYLILNTDISGMSYGERMIVANTARYHRRSDPSLEHEAFKSLTKTDRQKVKILTSLLRVADALDRQHLGKVTDLRAEIDSLRKRVVLHIVGDEERELEEWTVRRKSALFSEIFQLSVEIGTERKRDQSPHFRSPQSKNQGTKKA